MQQKEKVSVSERLKIACFGKNGKPKWVDNFLRIFQHSHSKGLEIKGKCTIECFGPDGRLKWKEEGIPNLVVTTGLNHIADQLSDHGESAMGWIAAGSNNTAPAAGDTALGTELGRVATDSITQTGGNTVVYVATFAPGTGTGTWEEVGIFNAASSGVMLDRLLTGTKVKNSDESFSVTITLTISAA